MPRLMDHMHFSQMINEISENRLQPRNYELQSVVSHSVVQTAGDASLAKSRVMPVELFVPTFHDNF